MLVSYITFKVWSREGWKKVIFIKNRGFLKLRKKIMVIFQNGFSPKAASQQPRVFGGSPVTNHRY